MSDLPSDEWELSVLPEQVCYIVVKAREFDAKDVSADDDGGSNSSDDNMVSVLEDSDEDPVSEELIAFIDALTEDAQIELVALAWLGRGDDDRASWDDLRQEAEDQHNEHTAAYLLGLPLLADYLEEGLSQFGQSCADIDPGRL
jgi:hypothetical protein